VNRPSQSLDVPAMITKLDDLRKQGILTDEEFQEKKKKLLANI
jgi:Short C-terminal domain